MLQKLRQTLEAHLDGEFEASQSYDPKANQPDYLGGKWCVGQRYLKSDISLFDLKEAAALACIRCGRVRSPQLFDTQFLGDHY